MLIQALCPTGPHCAMKQIVEKPLTLANWRNKTLSIVCGVVHRFPTIEVWSVGLNAAEWCPIFYCTLNPVHVPRKEIFIK